MTTFEYRIIHFSLLIVIPLLAGGWGALSPYYLKSKTKARAQSALRELPDILDLLTVSLEAGLGFDGALSKVVS